MTLNEMVDTIAHEAVLNGGTIGRALIIKKYPGEPLQLICDAMRYMDLHGMATVRYTDNLPLLLTMNR